MEKRLGKGLGALLGGSVNPEPQGGPFDRQSEPGSGKRQDSPDALDALDAQGKDMQGDASGKALKSAPAGSRDLQGTSQESPGNRTGRSMGIASSPASPILIPIDRICPNPQQPRQEFDPAGLEELRQSICQHGLLQPIVVRPGSAGYELIAGERRWRASKLAGLDTIPALVRARVSDREMLELAMVENVQRRDLNAIEKAKGYRALMTQLGLNQEEVAQKVGLNRSTVANQVRLLELPQEVQDALVRRLISAGHARALLGAGNETRILKLLGEIVRSDLSVREVERLAKETGQVKKSLPEQSAEAAEPWQMDLEKRLMEALGLSVQIRNDGHGNEPYKGQVVVSYFGQEQLDRVVDHIAPKDTL